ncbi:MAG: hypothetical protein K2X27_14955, partial [Candidatus Obscuribacterales bacterium]|nr:hypothetical protein [Candidatus Obscuribacterales bacterium]
MPNHLLNQFRLEARIKALRCLEDARHKIYSIAGGAIDSNSIDAAVISTEQRIEFFRSPEFLAWVAAEKACQREIFWCKDVDKTQAAGDIFTFFFDWRANNCKFSPHQLEVIQAFLKKHKVDVPLEQGPQEVLRLWQQKEEGG